MGNYLFFLGVTILLAILTCFSPTVSRRFLADSNPKVRVLNYILMGVAIFLAFISDIPFGIENSLLNWILNFLACIVSAVIIFLVIIAVAFIYDLYTLSKD